MPRALANQAPRSTSLQRSLQNGRQGNCSLQAISRLQVGQGRRCAALTMRSSSYGQQLSVKGTSTSVCFGRLSMSVHSRKRMLQR